MISKVFRCKNCVMISTRPRLTFNKNRICSACEWNEKKKKLIGKKEKLNLINF